jgi:two-component system LytT family response regulator
MFTAVLIDDEPSSLKILKGDLLEHFSNDIKILGGTSDFNEGVILIKEYNPDIVFLDIDLGNNKTGFDLLSKAREFDKNFKVIFCTAFNQFAIKAIKEQAFDYLLKPIDIEDLTITIKKLKEEITEPISYKKFIVINTTESIYKIYNDDLMYVKGDRGYSEFYVKNSKLPIVSSLTLSEVMKELEKANDIFYRIHKSFIVNKTEITKINKGLTSKTISVKNGVKIPVSRRKYSEFIKMFIND